LLTSRMPIHWLTLLCLASMATGCGESGMVEAAGKIKVAGQPATGGRITLTPVSAGERSQSLIAEDGAFLLRTKGVVGAKPGAYQVIYTRLASEEKGAKDRIGDMAAQEITVMYRSPAAQPLAIPENDVSDLEIDVNIHSGWTRTVSD
jgi:hypothetical protein